MGRRQALVCVVAVGCGPRLIVDDGGAAMDESTTTAAGDPDEGKPPRPADGPEPDPPDPDPSDPTTPGDGTTRGDDGPADTTGVPTTAGDDGGSPGGVGDGGSPDAPGDVELPNADAIAAAVYTDGTLVDFRVQFVEPPFIATTTAQDITWCIDGSPGGGSGSCTTHASGIESYLNLYQVLDGVSGEFQTDTPGLDLCLHGAFEAETNTLRMLVPRAVVDDDGDLDWIMTSSFGGSGGANEYVPDVGLQSSIFVDEFPPFSGTPTCF